MKEKTKLIMLGRGMTIIGALLILASVLYFVGTKNYNGLFQAFAVIGALFFTIPFLIIQIVAQTKKK